VRLEEKLKQFHAHQILVISPDKTPPVEKAEVLLTAFKLFHPQLAVFGTTSPCPRYRYVYPPSNFPLTKEKTFP